MTEPEPEREFSLTEARGALTQLVNEARYSGRSATIKQHKTAAARIVPPTALVLELDATALAQLEQARRFNPATGKPESIEDAAARLLGEALAGTGAGA